jgi:hypothetical protein
LFEVAAETVYLNVGMIKFLLTENLALKSLLHEKGILTPEEFQVHKSKAMEILDASMKGKIVQELRQVMGKLKENQDSAS